MTTHTPIEKQAPRSLAAADLTPRGRVFPSPGRWRDQVFYQLLPDRFSDGQEAQRPMFDYHQPGQFAAADKAAWMAAGNRFVGGTLKGVQSKLDYLQGLGVTTLWINPPWRQRAELQTYHGYGIQNYLDIDPRFGTRQDLRDLVDTAHDRGMYVILDVIYNHSGNNWFYRDEETGEPKDSRGYRYAPPRPVHGWRSATGASISMPQAIDDGVWPEELQNYEWYTRAGSIENWSIAAWEDPQSPEVEFRRGDFFDLKDWDLEKPEVLAALARVYQYWIALSDCDGFRADAVKHVSAEASRSFCSAIHEYADSIGKENFFITGEITDSSIAPAYIDIFQGNLDAVLGIIAYPNLLGGVVKGLLPPGEFFQLYDEHTFIGSVRQQGRYIVSVLDDHDMSSRSHKERFAAHGAPPVVYLQTAHVVGVQLTTPGMPSIYYGTEQALDGAEDYHDYGCEPKRFAEDRYVREAMFGGEFGAFGTRGCHFFNPDHPTYLRIAAIARLRNGSDGVGRTLRRGRLFPRETAFAGYPFAIPPAGELMAWSMTHYQTEVDMVLNTHGAASRGADVTVDAVKHPAGSMLSILYQSDWCDDELRQPPGDRTVRVTQQPDGRATVRVDLPPAGMMILG
ncbi:MAG: alpha-amylase [Caldilineaceae bacterium]|nr:alpha-amylase [Caldilineaceae bacterium]